MRGEMGKNERSRERKMHNQNSLCEKKVNFHKRKKVKRINNSDHFLFLIELKSFRF